MPDITHFERVGIFRMKLRKDMQFNWYVNCDLWFVASNFSYLIKFFGISETEMCEVIEIPCSGNLIHLSCYLNCYPWWGKFAISNLIRYIKLVDLKSGQLTTQEAIMKTGRRLRYLSLDLIWISSCDTLIAKPKVPMKCSNILFERVIFCN